MVLFDLHLKMYVLQIVLRVQAHDDWSFEHGGHNTSFDLGDIRVLEALELKFLCG